MKDKKKLSIVGLVLAIISLLPTVVSTKNLSTDKAISALFILLAVAGVVLGFLCKDKSKKISMASIIVGFIGVGLLLMNLAGFAMFSKLNNCVAKDNEMATCKYAGAEVTVPIFYLREDQMKKEETDIEEE